VSDTASPTSYSSQTPASAQCARMTLNTAGIAAGWAVESLPTARIMGESVLLPDGRVLIINGARTGVAGYGNVAQQVGQSNADNVRWQISCILSFVSALRLYFVADFSTRSL
jgi:hypothetical protein